MMTPSRSYYVLLCGVCLWCVLTLLPILQVVAPAALGPPAHAAERLFSTICHQFDSHSFHAFGAKCAVCVRCSSIYFGFLCGVLLWRLLRRHTLSRVWWIIAIVPMLVDVALDSSGILASGVLSRVLTGGWFGSIAGLILTPIIIQAVSYRSRMFHQSTTPAYESSIK